MTNFLEDIQTCGWKQTNDNVFEHGNRRIRALKTVYRMEQLQGGAWKVIANAKPEIATCVNGKIYGFTLT